MTADEATRIFEATARWYSPLADPEAVGPTGLIGLDERNDRREFQTADEATAWICSTDADEAEIIEFRQHVTYEPDPIVGVLPIVMPDPVWEWEWARTDDGWQTRIEGPAF